MPWGGRETAIGMVAWSTSFVLVGLAFVPVVKALAGPGGFSGLSQQQQALFALANQVVETAVGVGVVRLAVSKYAPLGGDFFRYDLRWVGSGGAGVLAWAPPAAD